MGFDNYNYKGVTENPTGRNPHTEPVTIADCDRWAAIARQRGYAREIAGLPEDAIRDACDADRRTRRTIAKAEGRS